MDSIIHAALHEICRGPSNGLLLRDLWPKLGPALASTGLPLCPVLKRDVWESLLEIPGLVMELADGCREDLMRITLEECEERVVNIVGSEAMRKSFLGTYEFEAASGGGTSKLINDVQRSIIRRLAVSRGNGILQSELSEELGIESKTLFYQLKILEILRLIAIYPALIRKKQASKNGEAEKDSVVNTNILYLYHHRKQLGPQQRLEINMEHKNSMRMEATDEYNLAGEYAKEDVKVEDLLPIMKAICDKLDKAEGKVLVVSDIKKDIGYQKRHKDWDKICRRLKDAKAAEKCYTMVNGKKVNCLRLVKSFSPPLFEKKFHGEREDEIDVNKMADSVKRGQITEVVLELPILRQVYDMIDAAGSQGLTNTDVCRRLGLCSREYHKRYFSQLVSRFRVHTRLEIQNRNLVYRVWTAENFISKPHNELSERETSTKKFTESNPHVVDYFPEKLPHPLQIVDTSKSMGNVRSITGHDNDAAVMTEASIGTNVDAVGKNGLVLQCANPENPDAGLVGEIPDEELCAVRKSAVIVGPRLRRSRRRSSLTMSSVSRDREQYIPALFQEEKFLVRPEFHRRLENLENTKMDEKTVECYLKKLKKERHCKFIYVHVPAVSKCDQSRKTVTQVVLHPSVHNVSRELLEQIHDRMSFFGIQVHRQSYPRQKKCKSVPVIENVPRIPSSIPLDVQSYHAEMMRANGFVPAKMVRTKLLHIFLWGSVGSFSNGHVSDLQNPHSFRKLFELDRAIKSMPLELFLQVVGSPRKIENMVEKCQSGLLLSDLPLQDYKCLMDNRACAGLSSLVNVLHRLKLIHLLSEGQLENSSSKDVSFTHALELKPYVEEPVSTVASSGSVLPDRRPQVRHNFVLSSREAVDEYWNTLEYCYTAAKSDAAFLAFPGSTVKEVFHAQSWTSVRVMTASQRAELFKCLESYDAQKKLSICECQKIAKDLDLTMEQVRRVHYDKRQQHITRHHSVHDAEGQQLKPIEGKYILPSRKRKHISSSVSTNDVMSSRRVDKLQRIKENFSDQENMENEEDLDNSGESKAPGQRSSSIKLPRKYTKIFSKAGSAKKHVHESVAIANAVELFKLIFLSTSTAPEVPPLLAETLRRYSEHDLTAAFDYLREKKFVIGGSCNNPFSLSQHFVNNIHKPEFPQDTGQRADKCLRWIRKRENYLMENGVDVPSDWQCGEVATLLSLVSSGEFSIIPCLPNEGVGETEDYLTSRYECENKFDGREKSKKVKTLSYGEPRHEKGFSGIKVEFHREKIPVVSVVESYKDRPTTKFGGEDQLNSVSGLDGIGASPCLDLADHVTKILDCSSENAHELGLSNSPWEAMASYAEYLISSRSHQVKCSFLHPSLFETLNSAIQKSGDQGLSLKEIQKILNIEDEKMLDIMLEVLETCGRASKVNGYDCVHVVDSLHLSKYFLTSSRDHPVVHGRKRKLEDELKLLNLDNSIDNSETNFELNMNVDEVHKITIVNMSKDVPDSLQSVGKEKTGDDKNSEVVPHKMRGCEKSKVHSYDTSTYSPILPWMKGDGTINENVFRGLIRRVLGIVMKNPGIKEDDILKKMDRLNPQVPQVPQFSNRKSFLIWSRNGQGI